MNSKNQNEKSIQYLPFYIALGGGVGLILGNLIFDNITLGMSIGAGIGVSAWIILNNKKVRGIK